MIDQTAINQVAANNGVPPSILSAIAARDLSTGMMGMNEGTVAGFGFTSSEIQGDQNLGLEVAARALQQSFSRYGNWEQALSYYTAGDPDAYQNPNSDVGGFVYATLGQAASNPGLGLNGIS